MEGIEGLVFMLLLAGVAVVVIAIVAAQAALRRRQAMWSHFAAERGGVHVVPAGWFTRERERIELALHGIAAILETYTEGSGKNRVYYSRWAAGFAHRPAPRCKVYREGFLASIGKALGAQDVVIGADAAFDQAFMVKCDRPEVVRRLWTPAATQPMLGWFPRGTVEADGTSVSLVEVGVVADPARMDAGFALVVELARRDCFGSEALRAVGGAGYRETEHGPQAALEAPARVVLGPEPVGGRLVTVARLGADPGLPPMVLEVDPSGRPADPGLAGALPQAAQVHLRQVGAGTLIIEPGATRFGWPEIQTDPQRLRAAAQLLGALSTGGTGGVFR